MTARWIMCYKPDSDMFVRGNTPIKPDPMPADHVVIPWAPSVTGKGFPPVWKSALDHKRDTPIGVWKTMVSKLSCTFDNATNKVLCNGHGLSDDTRIEFGGDGILPAELNKGLGYYIINADTDDFQLSLTKGGAAVTFTDDGSGENTFGDVPDDDDPWTIPVEVTNQMLRRSNYILECDELRAAYQGYLDDGGTPGEGPEYTAYMAKRNEIKAAWPVT